MVVNPCTGCSACKNICPQAAIEMMSDEEGFLYPHVDRYDIDVQKNGKAVHLDIKDVKNPLRLFKTLTETSDLSKLFYSKENPVYLVIPEHRISIYTQTNRNLSYIEQLRSYLTEAGMDIRVIREARLPVMLNSEWRCQDEPLS